MSVLFPCHRWHLSVRLNVVATLVAAMLVWYGAHVFGHYDVCLPPGALEAPLSGDGTVPLPGKRAVHAA